MKRMTRTMTGCVILSIAVGGLAVAPLFAQSDELTAVLQVDAGGQAMEMRFYLDPERMRLDVAEDNSLIFVGGASPTIRMVMHAQKSYMELSGQQLQMMQQMMQQMQNQNPGGAQSASIDPSQLSFETTSNRQQVGAWDAVEVLMTGPDGQDGSLWFTTDADTGLFELMARAGEALGSLQLPMAAGGMGAAQQMLAYRAVAEAQGLPDGYVVRIDSRSAGAEAQITLASIDTGSLPAGTFDAPDGYQTMQMPFAAPGARN